ncbi:hypothetical protein [Scytonema sp. NUACC21]
MQYGASAIVTDACIFMPILYVI